MSRWKLVFLSLFAVVAMSAVAAASASALEFYVEGHLITELLSITLLGGTQKLTGEVGGAKTEIICKHLDGNGSIHNGGTPVMGLGLALFLYLECTITSPKPKSVEGCQVPEEKIHNFVKVLAITLENTEKTPALEFTPDGGTAFVNVSLVNCKNTGLNGEHEVTGHARADVNNTTHEIEAKTGEGELSFAGNPATYEGKGKVEMVGGGLILVE
jgi:hypothetical protein